ncbi:cytochrome c oxidase subunit 7C, mitochondrial-like [Centruroides sculpturatus]|uniref:cytochrome c oxidase subunit 7C, mitochondrial-like n=1 Tax=Centruroides sculpturatus TaxID=218467 RepID=UPI000C6CCF00|nr:cytochrome c oxidase subunit 7C, mitochondrial-like [Centruroides sculpturatus]
MVPVSRLGCLVRKFGTSALRRGGHDEGGYAGANLPFPTHNRFLLTGLFILFFGSGFATPFLLVRFQMLKK